MNRGNFYTLILGFILMVLSNHLFPQYLRDSTRFIGLSDFYPREDSVVLERYLREEKYPLSFDNSFSIPEIPVQFDKKIIPFQLDFGNSAHINITTNISDSIDYFVVDTINTYTPDGRIRGKVWSIMIPEFKTLDQSFYNETGILADWSIFSTSPFNGVVGLKYLDGKCFTLSYPRKLLAVSNRSVSQELESESGDWIQMEYFNMHPYGVHFQGKVNEQEVIIYFDTGKSHSAINQDLVPAERIISDKSGSFFNGSVDIEIGERRFSIYYPRVKNTNRSIESDLPVGIEIGSDVLKYFLLTIDRTNSKNLLILHH